MTRVDVEVESSMVSPRTLAMLYDLHLAAVWRGQESPGDFGAWLEGRWWGGGMAEPDSPPEAVSVLGGAGAGIRWYKTDDAILGFVGGRLRGCYVIARDDALPQAPTGSVELAVDVIPALVPMS